jgi:UDPglucose--hexose-1-phosphate uridylyltransferase
MGRLANHDMIGGLRNPDYTSTFVFDNDFAALLLDEVPVQPSRHPLLTSIPERGLCRVFASRLAMT